jgi:hypothetical protein
LSSAGQFENTHDLLGDLFGAKNAGVTVLQVMTQVDLGLTSVGWFDSADSVISINDVN